MARIAKSLATLRAQIDAAHPGRAKFNDGWIGDTAHQARKSDHNPNGAGVVQAVDLSHDPAHGFDSYAFADMLRQKRDPRIKYVISNSRIFSSAVHPWEWRPYSGADSHSHHVHVSASDSAALYDDDHAWDIAPDGTAPAVVPPPPVAPPPGIDGTVRQSMAKHIFDFEARRDKAGHLMVYHPPANDGGGSYEVAGINQKFDPVQAAHLKELVEAGKFDEAERYAEDYILQNTNPATSWTTNAAVEFYLRDCVLNRGAGGAAKILQYAVGVSKDWSDHRAIDGRIGPTSRKFIHLFDAKPAELLAALRESRESYERHVVGYRENFWNGLVNRWNNSLAVAKTYL